MFYSKCISLKAKAIVSYHFFPSLRQFDEIACNRKVAVNSEKGRTFQIRIGTIFWPSFAIRSGFSSHRKLAESWLLTCHAHFLSQLHQLLMLGLLNDGLIWLHWTTWPTSLPRPPPLLSPGFSGSSIRLLCITIIWSLNVATHPLCITSKDLVALSFQQIHLLAETELRPFKAPRNYIGHTLAQLFM